MLWTGDLGITVGHYAIMETTTKYFDYNDFATKMLEAAGGKANVKAVILVGRDCEKVLGDGTAEDTWTSVLGPSFYDKDWKPTAHMAFVVPKGQVDVDVSLVGGLTIKSKKTTATVTLSFVACGMKTSIALDF